MQPGNPSAATEKKGGGALVAVVVIAAVVVMCVVFIGILAAIAIPSFIGYVRRAKTAEAQSNLRAIAASERAYCQERYALVTNAGPVPASPGPAKQLAAFSSDPGFMALGFTPSDYVYYSYSIVPDPDNAGGAIIRAQGDLDGDGVVSTFELRCAAACTSDPLPRVTNETE